MSSSSIKNPAITPVLEIAIRARRMLGAQAFLSEREWLDPVLGIREWIGKQAEKGKVRAIKMMLESDPMTIRPRIAVQIKRLRRGNTDKDRRALERIFDSLKMGLLQTRVGPPTKVTDEELRMELTRMFLRYLGADEDL